MKVLLIEPPRWKGWPMMRADRCSRPSFYGKGLSPFPYWLASTAGYLRQNKIDIDVLDANALNLSWPDVKERIVKFKPNIVFFTGANCSIDWDLQVATTAKEIDRNIITAVFEPLLAPQRSEEIFNEYPNLDVIFLSEPENIALDLCKKKFRASGIAYRFNGHIKKNKCNYQDISHLPMPAYDLLPMKLYDEITLRISRGCPFSCTFCTLGSVNKDSGLYFEKMLRFRDIKEVIGELTYLKKMDFGEKINFNDETFTVNKKKTIDFCDDLLENNLKIKFRIQTRVDCVDEEILKKLKKAGCECIGYGIESGDDTILKTIKKNTTTAQIKNAFRLTREVGIKISAFNIVGQVGETKETVRKTIELNKILLPDLVQFGIATPMIGTEFWNYCVKNKYLISDPRTVERAIVGIHAHMEYPDLKREELYALVRRGLKEINLSYFREPPKSLSSKVRFILKRVKTAYVLYKLPKTEFPGKTSICKY